MNWIATRPAKLASSCGLFFVALLLGCTAHAVSAAAETPPDLLWQVPEDKQEGSEAGRLANPRGLATSPVNGHVYVAEISNARISEFTAWGEFVRAFGWGVDDGAAKAEVCTAPSGCQAGIKGDGPGQLRFAAGVAVDAAGDVYVYDWENLRVTKFSPTGQFLLMFGGEVDKTSKANVCTAADLEAGDECGAGASGTAPGFFSFSSVRPIIAAAPDGTIYVGDKDRIEAFEADGSFKSQIPFTGELAALAGGRIEGLAIDPVSGDIYLSHNAEPSNVLPEVARHVYRISPSGELRGLVEDEIEFEGNPKTVPTNPRALAIDSAGNLYVIDREDLRDAEAGPFEVLKFDPDGNCLICGQRFAQPDRLIVGGVVIAGLATSSACGIAGSDLYVSFGLGGASYLHAYGPAPQDTADCPPPKRPPAIEDQYATAASTDSATVVAKINPRFWPDTAYQVQWGGQQCFDSNWSEGCQLTPASPQTLTDKVTSSSVPTAPVELSGLAPDTTYHYRFLAQSSGGGPVYGVGGTVGVPGSSAAFHTLPLPLPEQGSCLNQPFRTGASARLPDCRAYEMVSPVDKAGGGITTGLALQSKSPTALYLGSEDGESVTYSSSTAFAGGPSAPFTSQYLARRDPAAGWLTEAISPPRSQPFIEKYPDLATAQTDLQYKLFSPDLGQAWLMQEADPPLDGCGVPGYFNFYRRDNTSGAYEAVTTVAPPTRAPNHYFPEVQGASADGTRTVFRANDSLTPDAAAISDYQLYEHIGEPGGCGSIRLVSVLPGGGPAEGGASVGTLGVEAAGVPWVESRDNAVKHAVSEDGSKIYWTAAGNGPGALYVRVNGTQTFVVSKEPARFWAANVSGTIAYYTQGEDLFRFALGTKKSTLVAGQVAGVVAVSDDGQRAYFVSEEALGGGAVAGEPNLYLYREGNTTYVATLSAADVSQGRYYGLTATRPIRRRAQISPDGAFLAFTSHAALTGSENRDLKSGLPVTEAYLYDADAGQLRCVSCAVTGVRPSGYQEREINGIASVGSAQVPPWQNQFHAPRVISSDGSRVFFESYEPLVASDENEAQDVYEWQRAVSEADCEAAGAELYNPEAGGCISLISSGKGEQNSFFADAEGPNVFFRTQDSLLPQDSAAVDLYDARVGGGFPEPAAGCGEGCPPPPPPAEPAADPTPQSADAGAEPAAPPDCAPLRARAKALAARARTLQVKARKAPPAKARNLSAKARKLEKQAKKLKQKARNCAKGGKY